MPARMREVDRQLTKRAADGIPPGIAKALSAVEEAAEGATLWCGAAVLMLGLGGLQGRRAAATGLTATVGRSRRAAGCANSWPPGPGRPGNGSRTSRSRTALAVRTVPARTARLSLRPSRSRRAMLPLAAPCLPASRSQSGAGRPRLPWRQSIGRPVWATAAWRRGVLLDMPRPAAGRHHCGQHHRSIVVVVPGRFGALSRRVGRSAVGFGGADAAESRVRIALDGQVTDGDDAHRVMSLVDDRYTPHGVPTHHVHRQGLRSCGHAQGTCPRAQRTADDFVRHATSK